MVLGTSIDKYIYHSILMRDMRLVGDKFVISYSKIEKVNEIDEIQHRPMREILRNFEIPSGIEIHVAADLPAFSGLGSSSSFTVGLLNGLNASFSKKISTMQLCKEAIRVEQEVLREHVGSQDQTFAAFGGLNLVRFSKSGDIAVEPISVSEQRRNELNSSLLLFFTGIRRSAQNIEKEKIKNISNIDDNLLQMMKHVDQGLNILCGDLPLEHFGDLLHSAWIQKKQLASSVSSDEIDNMYKLAIDAGALGGKILGAGGGGFLLLYVPRERQSTVRQALVGFNEIKFKFTNVGSTILHR